MDSTLGENTAKTVLVRADCFSQTETNSSRQRTRRKNDSAARGNLQGAAVETPERRNEGRGRGVSVFVHMTARH